MTKVPRGEDPSAEAPRRSRAGEKGDGTEVGSVVVEGPCNCPPSLMLDTSWERALGKKREIQLWSAVSA